MSKREPHSSEVLPLLNALFHTNCEDELAIEASGLWQCAERSLTHRELKALRLRYVSNQTLAEIGAQIGGVTGSRAREIIQKACRRLRHPDRLNRIKAAVTGWPNLFRE